VQRIAAIRTPTKEDETKGIAMTNPTNPADGAATAVGRRAHGAVTESAWFGHPAAAALAGGPWDRRWRLA
jgi:hypothetical protein